MNIYNRLHGRPEGSDREPQNLTAREFLGLDGSKGYTTAEQFKAYVVTLREEEVADLEFLFVWMNRNLRIDGHTKKRVDRGNRPYIYPRFHLSKKSAPGAKVILAAGMEKLINDYAEGVVSIKFLLDELVEETINA